MTTKQIEVEIFDQPYRLVCASESEAALFESAALVDQKMREANERGSIRGIDRIAVMAALSIASELIQLQKSVRHGEALPIEEIQRTIQQMNQQLTAAIQQYD